MPRSGLLSPNHPAATNETIIEEGGVCEIATGMVEDPLSLSTTIKGLGSLVINAKSRSHDFSQEIAISVAIATGDQP